MGLVDSLWTTIRTALGRLGQTPDPTASPHLSLEPRGPTLMAEAADPAGPPNGPPRGLRIAPKRKASSPTFPPQPPFGNYQAPPPPLQPGFPADNGFTRGLGADPAWTSTSMTGMPRPNPDSYDDRREGAPGTITRFGRIRFEEFNLDLENEKGLGDGLGNQGVYDLMRKTDPQVRRALMLLKYPVLAANWKVEPGEDTPLAKEIAEFVSYVAFECNNWQQVIREALLMLDFGFSLFEILKDYADVPRTRFPNLPHENGPGRPGLSETVKAIVWTGLELRHPKTIYQWAANPYHPTQLDFVVQRIAGADVDSAGYRAISSDRFLRFTHDQEAGNFAGVPVLRTVYKPWKMKEVLEIVDVIRHERMNVGLAKCKAPQNPAKEDVDKLEAILPTLGSHHAMYLMLAYGWEFEWETSGQGEGTKVEAAIERCTREIADNILAGFMTLGNGDTGSYAMADKQSDRTDDAIEDVARLLEAVINHGSDGKSFIKELVDLNYGPQAFYPRMRIRNLRSRDYAQVINLLPKLMVAGALTSDAALRNFLRERMDLPPEGEPDLREDDDPQDQKELAEEALEHMPQEGPPGKTPAPPVPGDPNSVKAAPGTATVPQGGAPQGRPAPGAPAKPAAAPAKAAASSGTQLVLEALFRRARVDLSAEASP